MTPLSHISALEAVLFLNGEAIHFDRLATILTLSIDEVRSSVQALSDKYAQDNERGLFLIVHHEQVKLATKPRHAALIESYIKSSLQENLSKPALEVLAIIAYRAPLTRNEIESIRGVNCTFTLRNLLMRGLIERQGNMESARGYVYSLTFSFLESLGLKNIEELPEYVALSQDARLEIAHEGDS